MVKSFKDLNFGAHDTIVDSLNDLNTTVLAKANQVDLDAANASLAEKAQQSDLGTVSTFRPQDDSPSPKSLTDKIIKELQEHSVNLTSYTSYAVGSDWTNALQQAINDGYTAIFIPFPISITTVNLPPNRPIKIFTHHYVNIYGTPLITILSGGSGISLNGVGGSLVTGIVLDGLSFTSNGVSVNSAIKSNNISGFFFNNLFFSNVKGSAIQGNGFLYDGGIENVHMMDCGDVGKSVFKIGDVGTDSNRVSTRNLRIERASGLLLDIQGSAYAIEFEDTKLHGDSVGLLSTSSTSYGIRFNGGQFNLRTTADTISLDGNGNKIEGVTFTTSSGNDISGAIAIKGNLNSITRSTFNNVKGKVIDMTGAQAEASFNKFIASDYINSSGAFNDIIGNKWNNCSTSFGKIINVTGDYTKVKDNLTNNSTVASTSFVGAYNGKGMTIKDNTAFGANISHTVDMNAVQSLVDNNIGKSITGTIVNDYSAGGTNTVTTTNRIIS